MTKVWASSSPTDLNWILDKRCFYWWGWKNEPHMEKQNMHSHNSQKRMLRLYHTWGLLYFPPGLQLHIETSPVLTWTPLRGCATMTIGDINIHDYFTAELQTQLRQPRSSWGIGTPKIWWVYVPELGAMSRWIFHFGEPHVAISIIIILLSHYMKNRFQSISDPKPIVQTNTLSKSPIVHG